MSKTFEILTSALAESISEAKNNPIINKKQHQIKNKSQYNNPVWCTSYYKGSGKEIQKRKQRSHKKLLAKLHSTGLPELINNHTYELGVLYDMNNLPSDFPEPTQETIDYYKILDKEYRQRIRNCSPIIKNRAENLLKLRDELSLDDFNKLIQEGLECDPDFLFGLALDELLEKVNY